MVLKRRSEDGSCELDQDITIYQETKVSVGYINRSQLLETVETWNISM